jgi:uncharacterized protein YyaL (SSP411 family)
MTPRQARTRREITDAMHAAGGDSTRAAELLGCTRVTFQQRAKRAGISLDRLRIAAEDVARATPVEGAAVLTETGVALSLADYAILQARAAEGYEVPGLRAALETAERIIASLTARLEDAGGPRVSKSTGWHEVSGSRRWEAWP